MRRMAGKVLVVESERAARETCAEVLNGLGYNTEVAESAPRALDVLSTDQVEVVLINSGLASADDFKLVRAIKQKFPVLEVVLMKAPEATDQTAQALQVGAYGCVSRPLRVNEIKHIFRQIEERQRLADDNRLLREQLKSSRGFGSLVGASEKMEHVYRLIAKVAAKRHPVLILGESGTGKEIVARAIHAQSPWHDQPFVPVDCGALTPSLIESELFGHVRGAFTGATESRQGLLATAGSGSVFLDEIAELPLELQSRLLRALQEREIRPIGSNARMRFEARVIAATNQDVAAAIKRGAFRKDLYFHLNVVSIKVAPLRERRSDIALLIHHFIDRHGGPAGRTRGVSYEAMTRLMNYDWPGNVRELENCVQRALALGAGAQIEVKDLPSSLLNPQASTAGRAELSTLRELERRAILEALETTGGDRLRAAKLLGIGKTTIYRKLKEYGVEGPSHSSGPA